MLAKTTQFAIPAAKTLGTLPTGPGWSRDPKDIRGQANPRIPSWQISLLTVGMFTKAALGLD